MPELDENGEEFGGPVKSFLEHMEDLRWVLIRCVAALGVAMVACLAGAPLLVDTLARPLGEAKQFLTENRMETLSEEGKSEIHVRLTQEEVFRIPVETNLLDEAYKLLDLTNKVTTFNLIPAVEDGKLQLLLQPSTNTQAAGDDSTQAGPELKSMGPLSGFLVALQMAFYGGIMISLPFILFFLGEFTFPALRKKERKYLVTAVIIGGGLFFCGAAFCYFLLMEIALSTAALFANWLNFGADIWRAEDYITFVCKFMIGMGISFELPVVILLLVKIGVLDYKKLSKFRMYWVIINLILASILTPPDLVTQVLMALPMQIFYECSIFIAWIWYRRDRRRKRHNSQKKRPRRIKRPRTSLKNSAKRLYTGGFLANAAFRFLTNPMRYFAKTTGCCRPRRTSSRWAVPALKTSWGAASAISASSPAWANSTVLSSKQPSGTARSTHTPQVSSVA